MITGGDNRQILKDAYRQVFRTPAGRMVLGDLLSFGHVFDQAHTPGDAVHTAFLDGGRRTVLRILGMSGLREEMTSAVADVLEKPQEAGYGPEVDED